MTGFSVHAETHLHTPKNVRKVMNYFSDASLSFKRRIYISPSSFDVYNWTICDKIVRKIYTFYTYLSKILHDCMYENEEEKILEPRNVYS